MSTKQDTNYPVLVQNLASLNIVDVSCGAHHTYKPRLPFCLFLYFFISLFGIFISLIIWLITIVLVLRVVGNYTPGVRDSVACWVMVIVEATSSCRGWWRCLLSGLFVSSLADRIIQCTLVPFLLLGSRFIYFLFFSLLFVWLFLVL